MIKLSTTAIFFMFISLDSFILLHGWGKKTFPCHLVCKKLSNNALKLCFWVNTEGCKRIT
ncbi:hypothetical protein MASR2M64_04150 [Candidatus Cloacimonadota bacterium]